MSFQHVGITRLVFREALRSPETGGNPPPAQAAPAAAAPAPALDRYYWETGTLDGDEECIEDDQGGIHWVSACIAGCLIHDRRGGVVAFTYDVTVAEKIVAALNAGGR